MVTIDDVLDEQVLDWADRNVGMAYELYIRRELDADIGNMPTAVDWFQTVIENSDYMCDAFIEWLRDVYAQEIVEWAVGVTV